MWKFKPCDERLRDQIVQESGTVPHALGTILVQRGCRSAEEAKRFLNPSLSSLRDPFELPDMERAVSRIRRALVNGEKITVFGDYDVDGVCSTALLTRTLRDLGGHVSAFIPGRLDDGYGLSPDTAAACLKQHAPALIVTVDCGTNSVAAVEQLARCDVDTVVTDHHEPGCLPLPPVPVVNPKRQADHPGRNLCGAGVAFKLCHALVKTGRENGCLASAALDLKGCLEEVAVATVADMVPLLGENRTLVRAGLKALENSAKAGWKALLKQSGISGPPQAWHAGFALGPRINAAGRIGRADDALELLMTELSSRAEELSCALDQANRERQSIEKTMVREAIQEIDTWFCDTEHFGLVIAREGWHPGVIGIVASRLVAHYNRPVAVIGLEDGRGRGSCRSINAFNMLETLNACSELLDRFGGHSMAAGLEVSGANLEAFKARFNEEAGKKLQGADLRPVLEIDSFLSLREADRELLTGLRLAGPFGQDNPEPVWAVFGAAASDCRILKEKHLKLTLADGSVQREAIGFNLAQKLPDGPVDAAFTIQENRWKGKSSVQLNICDLRPAEGGGVPL